MVSWRPLREVSLENLNECGGKAARLGEALRLGCPVVPGVVLSTEVYRRFMRQGGLQGEIASILMSMQPTAMPHFQAAEWAIRSAFEVRRIPDDVKAIIREAYHSLGSPSVVVRSSATSEDSPQLSFVGQHYSCSNVADEEQVIEATLNCWMSLFSAKALSYARRFGVDLLNSAMAVLIQPTVAISSWGALFTADPITGNPDVFLLEIQRGPRAGLYRLDPYERQPGEPGFWTQLRQIGLLLDEHMLAYQTVEWAISEGELTLLRVRPMSKTPTYLPTPPPEAIAAKGPLELVCTPGLTPRAMPPYSWYYRSRSPRMNEAYFRSVQRAFSRYSGRNDVYVQGYLYTHWLGWALPAPDGETTPLLRVIQDMRRLMAARNLDRSFRLLWRDARPRLDVLRDLDLSTLPARELSRHLQEVMGLTEAFWSECGSLGESGKLIPDMLIALGRSWLGDTGEIATLLRTTADPLSRRDEAFCLLARSDLPDDAAREQAFQAAFHRYRHLFLHGEPLEEGRDLRLWQENEAAARALVRAWKQRGSDTPCNQHEQVAAEYHEAERRVLGRLGRLQRAVFRYVLSVARRYVLLRSQSREPVLLAGLLERDAVREVGRRLQEAGIVSSADEAFLLEARELIDWLKGSLPRDMLVRIINERRDLYRRWWRYSPPDVIDLEKTVEAPLELSEEAGEMLPGRPISPGRAEGRARVVNTLGEATNILPGEVLVCQEPLFELSPWFGLVAGVVSERGGLLDHAAVLVREYSVPAVFGVEQVTQRVHTGDELLVDATRGVVVRRYKEPDWELL